MSFQLLKLQIGPVQEFIAQARSTRDLWSGSYLLSWLMAAGAKALVEAAGNDESVVLSPVLLEQPVYRFQRKLYAKLDHDVNDAILTPNFTNILVAQLPSGMAARAVDAMIEAIKAERDRIAQCCWDKLVKDRLVEDPNGNRADRFFAQVQVFPSITWQLTPAPPAGKREEWLKTVPLDAALREKLMSASDDFPAQITRNSWELDAVRSLRTFSGWYSGSGGCEKDSLTGREEGVIGGKDWWESQFEATTATGDNDHYPYRLTARDGESRSSKLWPILFRERQKDDWSGALQLIKRIWHWAYLTEVKKLNATHRREPNGKEFPFPSTPHLAVHDPAKNIREDYTEGVEEFKNQIRVTKEHTAYFAVLAMDGDQMGAWLGGEKNHSGPTKSFREDLSSRLSNFALHCVRPIVEACDGRLILAGGEDVLALLPADTAVPCAEFLRAAYRADASFIPSLTQMARRLRSHHLKGLEPKESAATGNRSRISPWLAAAAENNLFSAGTGPGVLGFTPLDAAGQPMSPVELRLPGGIVDLGSKDIPDVSAGIAIAHYKEPLQDVVHAAHAAEKRAKHELDRGSLAITLVKHSGETVKWGAKWNSGALALLDLIQKGRGEEVFSSRLPHRLVEVLSPYLVTREAGEDACLTEDAEFRARVNEIIAQEFSRVLERQKGKTGESTRAEFLGNNKPEQTLKGFLESLPITDAESRLQAVIGLCQVAAFIEPAVYSETFVKSDKPAA